jgi:hypothetical protein
MSIDLPETTCITSRVLRGISTGLKQSIVTLRVISQSSKHDSDRRVMGDKTNTLARRWEEASWLKRFCLEPYPEYLASSTNPPVGP